MTEFKLFWTDMKASDKREIAKRMESSVPYLSQIAHGHRRPGKHFRKALLAEMNRMMSMTTR